MAEGSRQDSCTVTSGAGRQSATWTEVIPGSSNSERWAQSSASASTVLITQHLPGLIR
jgi:hypothetical protein